MLVYIEPKGTDKLPESEVKETYVYMGLVIVALALCLMYWV